MTTSVTTELKFQRIPSNRTRCCEVTITGMDRLLLHYDNAALMRRAVDWRKEHKQDLHEPWDMREPAWSWISNIQYDGPNVAILQDHFLTCIRHAGDEVLLPKGINGNTFKNLTQLIYIEPYWITICVDGEPIPWKPIKRLRTEEDFSVHQSAARALGFELFCTHVGKHVRVRPCLKNWSARFIIQTTEPLFTVERMKTIFDIAGDRIGIGYWRPGGNTPGPFGRFTTSLKEI